MVGAHGAHGIPLEVVGAVMEMADVAWFALDHRKNNNINSKDTSSASAAAEKEDGSELVQLQKENLRLRAQLAENLALLQGIYKDPGVSHDCPPDLYDRLTAAVDSSSFLNKLEALREELEDGDKKSTKEDSAESSSVVDVPVDFNGELTWWVWVTDKIPPESLEEASEIDNENYVVVTEQNVVDGIANFIAVCIIENPQSKLFSPEELHRAVTRALVKIKEKRNWKSIWEAGRVIYTLATWGIALAGLYSNRRFLKVAAKGVGASAKLAMKML